ncbi:hypothetical protein GCM10009637_22550 [Brevibacterium luteolum]
MSSAEASGTKCAIPIAIGVAAAHTASPGRNFPRRWSVSLWPGLCGAAGLVWDWRAGAAVAPARVAAESLFSAMPSTLGRQESWQ